MFNIDIEPEADSRFDTAMVVGISVVGLLSSVFIGLILGMAIN